MSTIVFDPTAFRALFKAFANTACYSDDALQGFWDTATVYVSNENCGCSVLSTAQRTLACNLMTAHMAFIFNAIASGEPIAILRNATIDKVTVGVQPPPVDEGNTFQWWLSASPYGQQLLALLQMASAGGFYVGGLPERDAFRRVGGAFGGIPPGFCG